MILSKRHIDWRSTLNSFKIQKKTQNKTKITKLIERKSLYLFPYPLKFFSIYEILKFP